MRMKTAFLVSAWSMESVDTHQMWSVVLRRCREDVVSRFAKMVDRVSRSTVCKRREGEWSNDDDERRNGEGS
ncbi:hypothetical protein BVRB_2g037970 [Beta vulgaris subsp. vulgaris]|nr:hypothetical protein BVRB_2g037970 [Beta vulgaris subsp. vulgaris]